MLGRLSRAIAVAYPIYEPMCGIMVGRKHHIEFNYLHDDAPPLISFIKESKKKILKGPQKFLLKDVRCYAG